MCYFVNCQQQSGHSKLWNICERERFSNSKLTKPSVFLHDVAVLQSITKNVLLIRVSVTTGRS